MLNPSTSTICGGVLGAVVGLASACWPAQVADDRWSYPFTAGVSVGAAALLVASHVLVAVGFAALARSTRGLARTGAWVGVGSSVLLAVCETWSGFLASAPANGGAATALDTVYGVASMAVALGSLAAGLALRRAWPGVAGSLTVSGLFMLVIVTPAMISDVNLARSLALAAWSLLYVWFGVAIRTPARRPDVTTRRANQQA